MQGEQCSTLSQILKLWPKICARMLKFPCGCRCWPSVIINAIRRAGFSTAIIPAQRVRLRTEENESWLGQCLFILLGRCFVRCSGSTHSFWIKLFFRDGSIQDGPESLHDSSGRWFLMLNEPIPKFLCRLKLLVSQILETFVTFTSAVTWFTVHGED